jgi:hypothetical protein
VQCPKVNVSFTVRDTQITIRTITPQDESIEAQFVRDLSEDSRYLRFHSALKELSPELLPMIGRAAELAHVFYKSYARLRLTQAFATCICMYCRRTAACSSWPEPWDLIIRKLLMAS